MSDNSILPAYTDGDIDTNRTNEVSLFDMVQQAWSRRQTMMGGLGATAAAFLGTSLLAACDDETTGTSTSANAGDDVTVNAGANVPNAGR